MSFSDRESVEREKITCYFPPGAGREKSHDGGRKVGSKLTRWRRGGLFVFYASPLPFPSPVARVSGKELTKVRRAVLFRRFGAWARRGSFPPFAPPPPPPPPPPASVRRPKAKVSPESRSPLLLPSIRLLAPQSLISQAGGGPPSPLLFFMGGVGRIKEGSPPPRENKSPMTGQTLEFAIVSIDTRYHVSSSMTWFFSHHL